jgi:transposase
MRYELADGEWNVIKLMLPNKPRGVPRLDDRRVLNASFSSSRERSGSAMKHHGREG